MPDFDYREILNRFDARARQAGLPQLAVEELLGADERRSGEPIEDLLVYLAALREQLTLRSTLTEVATSKTINEILVQDSPPFGGFVVERDERLSRTLGAPDRLDLAGDPAVDAALERLSVVERAVRGWDHL